MKRICLACLVSLIFIAGCATSNTQPETSAHWTVSDSHREITQANQLEAVGVINDLVIMESSPEQLSASGPATVIGCLESGGKWLEEYQECEYMRPDTCKALGGEYNGCASACRHNPEPGMCIRMCVQVCSFK